LAFSNCDNCSWSRSGGIQLQRSVKTFVSGFDHEVCDFGTLSEKPVDYPKFIRPSAEVVARGLWFWIVIVGSGNGEAIVAD